MLKNNKKAIILVIIAFLFICIFLGINAFVNNVEYKSYKEFNNYLEEGKVVKAELSESSIVFTLDNGERYYTDSPGVSEIKKDLLLSGIETVDSDPYKNVSFVFDMLFYIFFFAMVIFAVKKFRSFTNDDFKLVKKTNVKFSDIAGMEELKQEMMKNVEVLKNPKVYIDKGLRPAKGIILEGPPGNGKTFFAKALAEEAKCNFISAKGADFQSAMMSMGARKIRALFKKAKRHSPCIIFIDEFDGIGEKRNYAGTGVDKENNRMIITLLNELDGFDPLNQILVIAATNKADSLDEALVRPGRFDLKYEIGNPDLETRKELINLYTKKKALEENIDIDVLAKAFNNLSCSTIETILNEAAMINELSGGDKITLENILEATNKVNGKIVVKNTKKLR